MFFESYVGVQGKISDGKGKTTVVTFSLYPNSDVPGTEWTDGLCRVSDESNVLHELFYSGHEVLLFKDELEVPILLTSEYTFRVVGPIVTQSRPSPYPFLLGHALSWAELPSPPESGSVARQKVYPIDHSLKWR